MSDTNITEFQRETFNALASGKYDNFCLMSCFVDGQPTVAICSLHYGDDDVEIIPHFIAPTPEMTLVDHDGVEAVQH